MSQNSVTLLVTLWKNTYTDVSFWGNFTQEQMVAEFFFIAKSMLGYEMVEVVFLGSWEELPTARSQ